jgi:hypothetical protein
MSSSNRAREARINAVHITLDDLLFASEEVHKLPPDDRDWEGRAHLMARLFSGEPDKAFAVDARLTAMARLIRAGALPGWTLPTAPDGSVQISEPVFLATATEPLILREHDASFERQSFVTRVLELAKPDGCA